MTRLTPHILSTTRAMSPVVRTGVEVGTPTRIQPDGDHAARL